MTNTDTIAQAIRTDYREIVELTGQTDIPVLWIRESENTSRYQRSEVDAALILLSCQDARLNPQSNQKTLGSAERKAAVRIGNQERHLIRIG